MSQPAFTDRDFVHLHLHSDYSLLQSTIQYKPLAKHLSKSGFKACAVTDYGNLFGAISFYMTMKDAGIHPIIGYEAYVTSGSRFERSVNTEPGEKPHYNLVLLAKNNDGFQNLIYLASKAYTEGFYNRPRIDLDILEERCDGLICLSGGRNGSLYHYLRTGDRERAETAAVRLNKMFRGEDFYIEIQPHMLNDGASFEQLLELGKSTTIPLAATNDAHYLTREDAKAHEVLNCVGGGRTFSEQTGYTLGSDEFYVRTGDEMFDLLGSNFAEAIANTCKIAEKCDLELDLKGSNLKLPRFPIPEGFPSELPDDYLRQVVSDGFAYRDATVFQPMTSVGSLRYPQRKYQERLVLELSVIERMGYAGYFLIVWEFIKFAREQGIPVGPGRGSAAGSLVAYCLGITDVDPLQYDLFFERFLNPERVSMPDIDIDFCIRGRAEVIDHVAELYGRDSVCQIITFGTMASRAAIKDVGRALNMPYGDVEKVAKLIPPPFRGRNISISEAIERVPDLKSMMASDPKVSELIDLALRVEGCARHSSVHAAGVVISPKPLHEIVPIAISPKNEITSQYEMGDLEKTGMLKMDFLGLTTLTIIADCLASIKEREDVTIDWPTVPLDDAETMELFGDGRTDAIFQFESSGMQEICRRLKPKTLEDLSALNALYRPGPIDGGMIEEFILRHRGEKEIEYLLPEMEEILKNTFGVLVYQEQIMQLAQKLAGYSLGEADLMRRAMGKKLQEEMAPHELKFIKGATERGIPKKTAKEIFDLMAKFADYGFNRSHSIAYAYLAFQTAYLKAHFPAHFYSAVLSHEADDSAKVYKYSSELRLMGLELLPPDVNESGQGFTPVGDAVRYGLNAIKGMGSATAHAIISARSSEPFKSLHDFVSRIEQGAINRRALESLISAGAFDSLAYEAVKINKWRPQLCGAIDDALTFAQNAWNDKLRGQSGLFGATVADSLTPELPDTTEWTTKEVLAHEKAAVGFYLSSHPLDEFKSILESLRIRNIADFGDFRPGMNVILAGIISGTQVRWSKKGNRFCSFRLEDASTNVKCLVWADAYSKCSKNLVDDAAAIIEGRVETADGSDVTVIVNEVRLIAEQAARASRSLSIAIPLKAVNEQFLDEMFALLSETPGRTGVFFELSADGVVTTLEAPALSVQGSCALEKRLAEKGCSVKWSL
jgi:DNA polymerase III subunit alpha